MIVYCSLPKPSLRGSLQPASRPPPPAKRGALAFFGVVSAVVPIRENIAEFEVAVQALIDEWWPLINPSAVADPDDPDEMLEMAEVGDSYPASWVLVVAGAPIDPDGPDGRRPHMSARYTNQNQSPYTGIGLLHDALQVWSG